MRTSVCYLLLAVLLMAAQPVFAQQPDSTIALYEGPIPCGREGELITEHRAGSDRRFMNITRPELHVYAPMERTHTGAAMLIIPGGGYYLEAYDWEGREPAELLAQHGVTVFVLLHRLPHWESDDCKSTVALADARQAMRRIRELADRYRLDTDRVGIMGSSAGGHLAASASVHPEWVGETDSRPDLTVLLYPVISMDPALGAHLGSRKNLLGPTPDLELEFYFDVPLHVSDRTPPAFLVHASDDTVVPPINAIRYYQALVDAGVGADLHLFNEGGHGFGLGRQAEGPVHDWTELLLDWLRFHTFIR